MTKQEVDTIHKRKIDRLPVLRDAMRQMLLDSSASLDDVPSGEQIVVGVKLWHYNWEDTHGMPNRITMQGQKQKLLDVQAGRAPRAALDTIIKVQEI